jgi:alpha-glucosidase (family GH31 glycosyl hydrolase)
VLDYYLLLGSPADVLAGYTALTGRAPVPPAWSFGWWQSRCSYASAEEVVGVVVEMRDAGIPMDVVHLALWQTPYLVARTRLHDRLVRAGGFVRTPDGGLLDIGVHFVAGYRGPVHVVDWTNPAAVRVMAEEYGRLLATGASVLKADFGEELPTGAVHAATAAARGEGEAVAWSRAGWAGAQRYPVHWGGDVPPAWEMLAPQLPAGTWTDWWTREPVAGPRWVRASHGLDTMPLYLREGAVVPTGPDIQWVGERPTDPLTVVVAPFEADGRTELAVPLDGREVTVRYQARAGRHRVEVDGHRGRVVLDAPPGVELRS